MKAEKVWKVLEKLLDNKYVVIEGQWNNILRGQLTKDKMLCFVSLGVGGICCRRVRL